MFRYWHFLLLAAVVSSPAHGDDAAAFLEGSQWETVGEGYRVVEGIAARGGTVYFTDVPDAELYRLETGKPEVLMDKATAQANGLAFGPDGVLYSACMAEPMITGWHLEDGARVRIPLPSPANDLVITASGDLYCTWGARNAVYHLNLSRPEAVKTTEVPGPNGISLSHDGKEVWVGEFRGDSVRALPILAGGELGPARVAFKVRVPEDGKGLIDGMTPLADGRLLVATALGVQIAATGSEPILIPNPTKQRANYVRIIADASGKRWMYVAYVKSLLRRATHLEPAPVGNR